MTTNTIMLAGSAAFIVMPAEAYKDGIRAGSMDVRDGLFTDNLVHPSGDVRLNDLYSNGYNDGREDYILEHCVGE